MRQTNGIHDFGGEMKHGSLLASIALAVSVAGLWFAGSDTAPAATQRANPLSGNPEAIDGGKRLFNTWCAQCHGSKAEGGKYGANLKIFSKGYKEFLATVRDERVQEDDAALEKTCWTTSPSTRSAPISKPWPSPERTGSEPAALGRR